MGVHDVRHQEAERDAAGGLARLGADGWEAIAMVSSWGVGWRLVHPIVLLKRPLADDRSQDASSDKTDTIDSFLGIVYRVIQ
jgi:hypothetical protein